MYALITGASRGIGKATAKEFAINGYNLVLVCKSHINELLKYSEELKTYGINCYCFQCDVSNPQSIDELFKALSQNNICCDVLINNAGISYVGLLQDMTIEEWNQTINTNLSSIFYMSKHCIPMMIHNNKGKIINISSVWGMVGASMEVAYSASKGGVISFTKALAKELAPSNIQVNSISFGAIDTEMNNHLTIEDRADLCDEIPAGRFGYPQEAGKLIYNLASFNEYVTGANITMDGAWC